MGHVAEGGEGHCPDDDDASSHSSRYLLYLNSISSSGICPTKKAINSQADRKPHSVGNLQNANYPKHTSQHIRHRPQQPNRPKFQRLAPQPLLKSLEVLRKKVGLSPFQMTQLRSTKQH